jgi:hypothetical protein
MKFDYFTAFQYVRFINSYRDWAYVGKYLESRKVFHIIKHRGISAYRRGTWHYNLGNGWR